MYFQRESYEGLVPGLLADDEYGEPETQIIYLPAAWSGSFLDYIDGQIQQTARYKEETSIVELGENSPDPELPACVSPTSHQVQATFCVRKLIELVLADFTWPRFRIEQHG